MNKIFNNQKLFEEVILNIFKDIDMSIKEIDFSEIENESLIIDGKEKDFDDIFDEVKYFIHRQNENSLDFDIAYSKKSDGWVYLLYRDAVFTSKNKNDLRAILEVLIYFYKEVYPTEYSNFNLEVLTIKKRS